MRTASIVVAAGSGTRFGGLQPKQFQSLNGRPVYEWALDTATVATEFVVLVVARDFKAVVPTGVSAHVIVEGGSTCSQSVRNGLERIPEEFDVVIVHDAARPVATSALFDAVAEAVGSGADAAVPGVPVTDTVKRVRGKPTPGNPARVLETVERADLVVVQTPQAFRAEVLRRAHLSKPDASDDAGLVEAMGGRVVVVSGETTNIKVTVPHDLLALEAMFDQ